MRLITAKEVARSVRSLLCFLQAFKGRRVVIEMRNDTFITGVLESIDAWMNVELSSAYIWSIYKQLQTMNFDHLQQSSSTPTVEISTAPDMNYIDTHPPEVDYIFIKGSRIRYFNLPDDVDVRQAIETEVQRYQRRAKGGDECLKPFNWKAYRKELKLAKMEDTPAGTSGSSSATTSSARQNT